MNTFTEALGWSLIHFVWQGALIGAAAALTLALMRHAKATHRYTVACVALLMCVCWPAIELATRLHGGASFIAAGQVQAAPALAATSNAILSGMQRYLTPIVLFWLACIVTLALRSLLGLLWIGRAERTGATDPQWQTRLSQLAARFDVRRHVRLRIVDDLGSPMTAGCWRPVVLVPAALISGMPPDLLEALLAHEMAHIRRHDYLVNLVQNVIEIVLFYHPAVWWLSRRIRQERELIADDLAASKSGEPRRLALALSELEKIQFSTHHLALRANGGDLMVRIKRLIHPETRGTNWKAVFPVLGMAMVCLNACATVSDGAAHKPGTVKPVLDFSTCAKPVWPAESLKAQHAGTVTLKFKVMDDGKIDGSDVIKSSGHSALDEAARIGIAKCRFKPGLEDGKPAASSVQVQYVWIPN